MTGMMPHCSGSISNIFGSSLSLEYRNLFTELKKGGYHTSLHGKCHFIPVPYPATRPDTTMEYEHFIQYYKLLGMDVLDLQDDKNNSLWYYDDYAKWMEKKGELTKYRDEAHMTPSNQGVFPFPWPAEDHPDAWVGRKTCERINSLPDDEPAFIWTSFSGPHYPVDTPQEFIDKVDMSKDRGRVWDPDEWDDDSKYHRNGYHGPGTTEGSGHAPDHAQKNYSEEYWSHWRQCYFGNVVMIDSWIGSIIECARKKWGDNFVVIFTSDHGEMMGNHSLWGKNGSLFEDVLRVPLMIYDPANEKKEVVKEITLSTDLFPTILRMAGCDVPDQCEGLTLDEDAARGGRKYIISECDNRVAIVKDGYKLELNRYQRTDHLYREFYDLHKDPHEFVNRFDCPEYADTIRELMGILEEKEKSEKLLSTVFYNTGDFPYWLNWGEGAGLMNKENK